MTATENVKKRIEMLEEKRLTVFFHMQNITSDLNGRLYTYNATVGVGALAIFLIAIIIKESDAFLVLWCKIFALAATVLALIHYLQALDKNAHNAHKNINTIYKSYDDEYFVLKKFNEGEINEDLIRQYYINKSKELDRFTANLTTPGWITWITTSLTITSSVLLLLA